MRSDGTVVEVLESGEERPFPETPMPPMTEEEIHAAAMADPDAQPMSPRRVADGQVCAAHKELAPHSRPHTARICGAVSHPSRHTSGLGARPRRT